MKRLKLLIFSIFLICVSSQIFGGEDGEPIKRGDLISHHLSALKKYGDGKPLFETSSRTLRIIEDMMWKIDDGVLVIEMSISAGIIKDMTYVITTGEKRTTLKVKEFNPTTGEMTIVFPNKPPGGNG